MWHFISNTYWLIHHSIHPFSIKPFHAFFLFHVDSNKLTVNISIALIRPCFIVTSIHCVIAQFFHCPWFMTLPSHFNVSSSPSLHSHPSVAHSLTRTSDNVVPLGADKCGCCDMKLGDGKMQSVSSCCQSGSDSTGGNERRIYWCAAQHAGFCETGIIPSRPSLIMKDERFDENGHSNVSQLKSFKGQWIHHIKSFRFWLRV